MFKIKIKSKISNLRTGVIKTIHGNLQTPFFMPDATRGHVKELLNADLKSAGVGPMIVNTFHLLLQPGQKIIKKAGGIHKFINYKMPLASDSGGFQVFSLIHQNPKMGKIYDDRVEFKSPLDGSKHILTPEKSIQIQFDLGVDMMICLDDCPPNNCDKRTLDAAVLRTIEWARRCRKEFDKQIKKRKFTKNKRPLLFAVIQGGVNRESRRKCADELLEIGFDGYGFGARPVDNDGNFLEDIINYTARLVPDNFLRFALGVGKPEDIVRCAKFGWDIFDCVIPTREGRHGRIFCKDKNFNHVILKYFGTKKVKLDRFYTPINIHNKKFVNDFSPINKKSKIPELRGYSKAYLHNLFRLKDPLGARLASMANLEFYTDLMGEIRKNL